MNDPLGFSAKNTLGNLDWLKANEDKIKSILPNSWTHMREVRMFEIAVRLKLMGVDWTTPEDLVKILQFIEKIGFMVRKGYLVKSNPQRVLKT